MAKDNTLTCFGEKYTWKKKFFTTFYRDPYTDVKISAIDAGNYIAVGTNFMDGKLYLFTKSGKKLWEHQFATIASLGWRPEDVTRISIGKGFVAVATQFMHDYVYAFNFNRKRLFEVRFEEVRNLFAEDNVVVVTDVGAVALNREGKVLFKCEGEVKYAFEYKDKIVLCGDINCDRDNVKTMQCDFAGKFGDNVYAVTGEKIAVFDNEFRKLWDFEANSRIVHVRGNSKLYVMSENEVLELDKRGNVEWKTEFDGKAVGVCRFGAVYFDGELKVIPIRQRLSTEKHL